MIVDTYAALELCQRLRAGRGPGGELLVDSFEVDALEAELERAISVPVEYGRVGVQGIAPGGRVLGYPEARAAWFRVEATCPVPAPELGLGLVGLPLAAPPRGSGR